jgi:hypothetical protein
VLRREIALVFYRNPADRHLERLIHARQANALDELIGYVFGQAVGLRVGTASPHPVHLGGSSRQLVVEHQAGSHLIIEPVQFGRRFLSHESPPFLSSHWQNFGLLFGFATSVAQDADTGM